MLNLCMCRTTIPHKGSRVIQLKLDIFRVDTCLFVPCCLVGSAYLDIYVVFAGFCYPLSFGLSCNILDTDLVLPLSL